MSLHEELDPYGDWGDLLADLEIQRLTGIPLADFDEPCVPSLDNGTHADYSKRVPMNGTEPARSDATWQRRS